MADKTLLVIVGPTGAGKTELALRWAQKAGAEIVSADSQQVYRGMDVGTGKASAAEQAHVPHHLLDVLTPDQEMTAGRFVQLADTAISEIWGQGKPVVVVGGTMLYVKALLQGLFDGPAADPRLRSELGMRAEREGLQSLWEELARVDTASSKKIHKTDPRRIIRALEVHQLTGVPLSEHHRIHQAKPARYKATIVGLAPERDQLYQQIDARVLRMMDAGFVQEVRKLRDEGYHAGLRSQQAIGYRELHKYLEGWSETPANSTEGAKHPRSAKQGAPQTDANSFGSSFLDEDGMAIEDAIALIQRNSRRYARRQLSWYRGQEDVEWHLSPSEVDLSDLGR